MEKNPGFEFFSFPADSADVSRRFTQIFLPIKIGNVKTDNKEILLCFFTPPPTPPQKGRGVVF
jgi:hypothetical protein